MPKSAPVKMTIEEVMSFLEEHGNEDGKTVFMRHGAREPFFGTRIADMKKITGKIKKDHELSLALYDTGNSDAMYFAGLIADETKITRKDLDRWVKQAYWYMLSEFTVPWVAAESPYGLELAREWIDSKHEMIAAAGWATFASILGLTPNDQLDMAEIDSLLKRVEKTIHTEQNRVRYAMNNYVISVGAHIPDYTERAKAIGGRIGKVSVDMGGTSCKVPLITPYIEKIEARGTIGKKRKTTRC